MSKQSGLGDQFYIGGYNISGDVNSLGNISGGNTPLDFTDITQSAMARQGGLRNGTVEFTTFFNVSAGQEHAALKGLPTADTQVMYLRGTTQGDPAAAMTAKQINYDGTRAADGAYAFNVQALSNGFGLEWGQNLTDGVRTDGSATSPSTGLDTLASAAFGAQAYLQVFSFTGTSVTVKIQDSADNSSFADISPSLVFSAVAAAPAFERVSIANTTTVRRYLRVITTGTFTNAVFAVVVVKNELAGQTF